MSAPDNTIPISNLFFDDTDPHVVSAGYAPQQTESARYTPARGHELQALLSTSIAQLGGVSRERSRRTPILPPPVPIDTLLYRGRAALDRALEIRSIVGDAMPSRETIDELFDLVALAATD
ncbi:MAG: hypothetical protein ABIQ55_01185 [Gemmatimonadaceae bacterium]